MPKGLGRAVTNQTALDVIGMLSDADMAERYRENLLGFTTVMLEGKFQLEHYVQAVRYVSQKLAGKNNKAAYYATFPDKVADWDARGVPASHVSSYITAFHKSKLVGLLLEQSIIPAWVLNQDVYQKAINTQLELMVSANSEKVRADAANSILTHLKPPEAKKVEIDVSVREDSLIDQLRASTAELVAQQRSMIEGRVVNARDVAEAAVLTVASNDENADGESSSGAGGEPAA